MIVSGFLCGVLAVSHSPEALSRLEMTPREVSPSEMTPIAGAGATLLHAPVGAISPM